MKQATTEFSNRGFNVINVSSKDEFARELKKPLNYERIAKRMQDDPKFKQIYEECLAFENNILNTTDILRQVVKLYQNGEKKADVARAGQIAVAKGLSELAITAADDKNISIIWKSFGYIIRKKGF